MRITNVKKNYGKKEVLNIKDANFDMKGIVGILGVNGAGKTTFFNVISGLITSNIESEYRNDISFFPDTEKFYRMNIKMFGIVLEGTYNDFNLDMFYQMLQSLNINIEDSIHKFSRGQKNVLNIVMTLARDTKYYFIDELFSNLDFETRETITKLLIEYTDVENKLIFISSHEIMDIERLLDYAVVLDKEDFTRVYPIEQIIEEHKTLYDWFESVIEGGRL